MKSDAIDKDCKTAPLPLAKGQHAVFCLSHNASLSPEKNECRRVLTNTVETAEPELAVGRTGQSFKATVNLTWKLLAPYPFGHQEMRDLLKDGNS